MDTETDTYVNMYVYVHLYSYRYPCEILQLYFHMWVYVVIAFVLVCKLRTPQHALEKDEHAVHLSPLPARLEGARQGRTGAGRRDGVPGTP